MIVADLEKIEGRRYPARRRTQNLVGGASPIQAKQFCMGNVTLDARGGQVPWHNQEQEEIYFIVHQLTNTGDEPLRMIYCYGPAGDVAHWRQELDGTLPKAGVEAPPLPVGAWPQCTERPGA
jgi:hypothetical protein